MNQNQRGGFSLRNQSTTHDRFGCSGRCDENANIAFRHRRDGIVLLLS